MTDRSAEDLEREAERIRSGIANTAEELRFRMSPGQMVDEVTRYLRDSDSSVALDNLRRQIRDNPLALVLIGAGVAWLMLGGRRESHEEERYRGAYGRDELRPATDQRERYESAYAAGARARPGAADVHPSGSAGVVGAGQSASSAGAIAPGSSYGRSEPVGSGGTGAGTSGSASTGSAGGSAAGSTGGGSAAAGVASSGASHPNSPGTSGVAYGPSGGRPSGGPSAGSSASSGATSGTTSGSSTKSSDTAGVARGGPGQGVTGVPTGSDAQRKPSATDTDKPGSQR